MRAQTGQTGSILTDLLMYLLKYPTLAMLPCGCGSGIRLAQDQWHAIDTEPAEEGDARSLSAGAVGHLSRPQTAGNPGRSSLRTRLNVSGFSDHTHSTVMCRSTIAAPQVRPVRARRLGTRLASHLCPPRCACAVAAPTHPGFTFRQTSLSWFGARKRQLGTVRDWHSLSLLRPPPSFRSRAVSPSGSGQDRCFRRNH